MTKAQEPSRTAQSIQGGTRSAASTRRRAPDRLTCCRMSATPEPGTISWQDLTVGDAEAVREFYQAVVGWKPEPLSMGAYSDFVMSADGTPVAGICHARAANADLPPVWLIYITVEDL